MVTDSTAKPSTSLFEEPSAIENEIPSYRAISPFAVLSFALGVSSVFCFTSRYWLVPACAAIVLGILADRKIQQCPDILTGGLLARLGIALAIVFGVASETYTQLQDFLLYRNAATFGKKVIKTLNARQTEDALWYMVPPELRKGLSPEDAEKQMKKLLKDSEKIHDYDFQIGQLYKRMDATKEPLQFVEVEGAEYFEMTGNAKILLRIGPAHHHAGSNEDDSEDYALLYIKSQPGTKGIRWFVERILHPYVRQSYKPVEKIKIDDGHNHGGGGGH